MPPPPSGGCKIRTQFRDFCLFFFFFFAGNSNSASSHRGCRRTFRPGGRQSKQATTWHASKPRPGARKEMHRAQEFDFLQLISGTILVLVQSWRFVDFGTIVGKISPTNKQASFCLICRRTFYQQWPALSIPTIQSIFPLPYGHAVSLVFVDQFFFRAGATDLVGETLCGGGLFSFTCGEPFSRRISTGKSVYITA